MTLTVTLDRAAGCALLHKDRWSLVVPMADLPRWRDFYRRLHDRKKSKGGGRPWAGFYAADVAALEAAVRESEVCDG